MVDVEMAHFPITSDYLEVDDFHPKPHTGVDFATPVGTQVQVPNDGVIKLIKIDPLLGRCIFVDLDNGVQMVVGHLSQINVTYGQHVIAGETIGLSGGVPGTSGAGHTTGPHVHITTRLIKDGSLVNPLTYVGGGPSGWGNVVEPIFIVLALLLFLAMPLFSRAKMIGRLMLICILFFVIMYKMA